MTAPAAPLPCGAFSTPRAGRWTARALRALGATWRVRVVGPDALGAGGLCALWHRDLVVAAWLFRDLGAAACVSRSRDGARAAAVLRHLGYADPARGSSSRGGAGALLALRRRLDAGVPVGLLTDGPRGPAQRSRRGAVRLARSSGVPVTPVACAARPCLHLASWDRTLVPLPFARVVVHVGEPIAVPADADPRREKALCRALDARLAALAAAAARDCGAAQGRRVACASS